MTKVTNMTNNKGRAVANQFIIFDGDNVTFQSYDSKIATLKRPNTLVLEGFMWDYSNTTRKYFKRFINDFTGFYYDNKAQWVKEIEKKDNIEVV